MVLRIKKLNSKINNLLSSMILDIKGHKFINFLKKNDFKNKN